MKNICSRLKEDQNTNAVDLDQNSKVEPDTEASVEKFMPLQSSKELDNSVSSTKKDTQRLKLEEKVKNLSKDLQTAKDKNIYLHMSLVDHKRKIEQLEQEVEKKEGRIKDFQAQINLLETQGPEAKALLVSNNWEEQHPQIDVEKTDTENPDFPQQPNLSENDTDGEVSHLQDNDQSIQILRKQLKEIRCNLDEANENVSKEKLEMQRLRQEINTLKSSERFCQEIDQANKNLLTDLQNQINSNEKLKVEVTKKDSQILALQSNILEGQNTIQALEELIHSLQKEIAQLQDLQKRFQTAKNELAEASEERVKLLNAKDILGQEISDLKRKNSDQEVQINQLTSQLELGDQRSQKLLSQLNLLQEAQQKSDKANASI